MAIASFPGLYLSFCRLQYGHIIQARYANTELRDLSKLLTSPIHVFGGAESS